MWELLAPAGSYDSLRAAVNAGADAVYTGGSLFGARAYADNPDEEHLIQGIEYCHLHGKKLYLTVNTLLKERELETLLYPYLFPYYKNGVDGLIVQDLGVVRLVQEMFPGLPVHASTQMTVTGPEGARLLQREGITRVVPARELSMEEIHAIAAETGIEVETFIHGAMCYSYSGQCLFSSMIGGRSGNRGRCAQPCRLPYRIAGGRNADNDQNAQNRQNTHNAKKSQESYLLSMKDMCTLDLLPELLDAGIVSLKIEGRMKRPEYTAGVVSVYRKYLDLYQTSGKDGYRVEEEDRSLLLDLYNRGGFSEGYYRTHNGKSMIAMKRPNHMGTVAARISGKSGLKLRAEALEPLGKGDVLELSPGTEVTLKEEIKKGSVFTVFSGKTFLANGSILYRTKNEQLLKCLEEKYVTDDIREKIKGELNIFPDSPAVLELQCRSVQIRVSDEIAQPAVSQPTSVDAVKRQLNKTGGTPFEFEELKVRIIGDVFVPVSRLNELRRKGLTLLQEIILARGRRGVPETSDAMGRGTVSEALNAAERKNNPMRASGDIRVNALVTTWEQLEAVLECSCFVFDTIYMDSLLLGDVQESETACSDIEEMIAKIKRQGYRCFLSCPPVLRELDRKMLTGSRVQSLLRKMDGFLIHTIDELSFFQSYIKDNNIRAELAADDNLYAYNRRAAAFWREQGVSRITLPAELNYKELLSLDTMDAELSVYGYQALMHSAQCVVKNTTGCTGVPCVTYLRDRKNVRFPVRNRCQVCCNTIYNSVPLMLCTCREEIKKLAPSYIRFAFTIESKEETESVLRRCSELLLGRAADDAGIDGTRGHFKRGVE